MAFRSVLLREPTEAPGSSEFAIPLYVSEHHYNRKHGPKATYGQK
jgi:hypothetical protein